MAALAFLLFQFGPKLFGGGKPTLQPLKNESRLVLSSNPRAPEAMCDVTTPEFRAQLTNRGAAVRHFQLLQPKYQVDGKPIDLSTTPDLDFNRQLRFDFRNSAGLPAGKEWNVDGNLVDWTIDGKDGKSCVFTYRDAKVELTKKVSATGRPYELAVEATIKNLADHSLYHSVTVHNDTWHTAKDVKGSMFRQSPNVTRVECVLDDGKPHRLGEGDFDAGKFSDAEHFVTSAVNPGDWYQTAGKPAFVAVSAAYFAQAVAPVAAPTGPVCQLLIEEHKVGDPENDGAIYRTRLAYPGVDLAPGASSTYSVLGYIDRALQGVTRQGTMAWKMVGFWFAVLALLTALVASPLSVVLLAPSGWPPGPRPEFWLAKPDDLAASSAAPLPPPIASSLASSVARLPGGVGAGWPGTAPA